MLKGMMAFTLILSVAGIVLGFGGFDFATMKSIW
jgi:hypothetical protein